MNNVKIGIIGAGPIGIDLAARCIKEGYQVIIFEAKEIASNVLSWGHIKLFSPWKLNISTTGIKVLDDLNKPVPDQDAFPTGNELVSDYLMHLAEYIKKQNGEIIEHEKVISIGRNTVIKTEDIGGKAVRCNSKFRVLTQNQNGDEKVYYVDKIVDTSGTYGNHNYIGPGGTPAIGELKHEKEIYHVIPDPSGKDHEKFTNAKKIVVIGNGYSAITSIHEILNHQKTQNITNQEIIWITRNEEEPYERIPNDSLPQRDQLAQLGNKISKQTNDSVKYHGNFESIERISKESNGKWRIQGYKKGSDNKEVTIDDIDIIVSNVGYKPDISLYRELQVHQCYASEGPMKLAASLLSSGSGGNSDCLAQASPGKESLLNTEPNFFILGSKSYGRNSKFLLRLGFEQIDHVIQLF